MKRGFIAIITPDRFDDLKKMNKSLRRFHQDPMCLMVARDRVEAHRFKTQCALFTPFDFTIMLDTDIYVNGDLSLLFQTAEQGQIGLIRERFHKVLNSGVIAFEKKAMIPVCREWNIAYETRVREGNRDKYAVMDQDILRNVLGFYKYVELPCEYNMTFHDIDPHKEGLEWKNIKIFHFLHAPDVPREKYRSYKEWNNQP